MKEKHLILIYLFCVGYINIVSSQDTNLARLEYVYLPQNQSDNAFSSFRFSGNYPIEINKKGTYVVGAFQYRYNNLQLKDPIIVDNEQDLEIFHTIGVEIGYTFKMKNDWRFGGKLGMRISSNLEGRGLVSDDYRYVGSVYFIKSYGEKADAAMSKLVLGISYSTPASINFPLPIINYFKKISSKWSYSLGTPKTNIKYFFNKKNSIQTFVGLDRFYGNIQNNRVFVDDNNARKLAENASMLIVNNAIGYEYYFTEHLLYFAYAGYTLVNEIRLRDSRQNNVLSINNQNTVYLRSGIKLKL